MDLSPVCILAIRNERDRKFMQALYTSHMHAMYLTAYRITQNAADTDDAVSAACVALIGSMEKLRQVSPKAVTAYVLTTVRNEALTLVKRRNVELRAITKIKADSVLPVESPPPDEELQLLYHRTLSEVVEAIRMLSEPEQMLMQMRFFEQMPYTKISELLDMPQSTIRTKISRARRRLLKLLEEKQDDE